MAASCSRMPLQICGVFRRYSCYSQLFRQASRYKSIRPSASHLSYRNILRSRPIFTSCHRFNQPGSSNTGSNDKPKPLVGIIKTVALKTHHATIWLLNKVSPRARGFYERFIDGMTSFVQDFRYVYSMNRRLKNKEVTLEDLDWKDLYRKMQMKEDIARVLPTLAVVNIPLVFYVALPVVLYFQRRFLSDHFITPEDIAINHAEYQKKRCLLYPHILKRLEKRLTKQPTTEESESLRIQLGQLEVEPLSAAQVLSYRSVFSQQAALKKLSRTHLKYLCKLHSQWVLFAPNSTLRRRLLDHARLMTMMDRAVLSCDLNHIDDLDLRKLCNQRGFNPVGSDCEALGSWLREWSHVSSTLTDEEQSLLLHSSILLVAGRPNQGLEDTKTTKQSDV